MNDQINPQNGQDENTSNGTPIQETPGQQPTQADGQEPPVQEQGASPAQGEAFQLDFTVDEQNKKKQMTIAIAAVAVVVLIVGAIFMMIPRDRPGVIGGVSRTDEPDRYLQMAMDRSGLGAQAGFDQLFDFDFAPFDLARFSGSPVEHSLSLTFDDPINLMDAHGELRLLMDEDAGNFLVELDVGMGALSFNNNRLFVSDDIIALSIPDLYTRHQYLYVNPNTFVEDWNNSAFARMVPLDPSEVEMATGLMTSYFDMFNFDALEEFLDEHAEQMAAMSDQMLTSGAFLDEGDMEITIGGRTYTVAKLGRRVTEDAIDEFIDSFMEIYIDLMRSFMDGFIDNIAQADPFFNPDRMWDDMERMASSLRFPGGFRYYAYIDLETGLVRRMDILDMIIGMDAEEITIDMIIEYRGQHNVSDIIYSFITMTDRYGEILEMEMRIYMPQGGPYMLYMNMHSEVSTMIFDIGYDPLADMDNIWLNFSVEGDWTAVEDDWTTMVHFNMRGDVVNNEDRFSIQNGRIHASSDGQTMLAARFEYGLRNVLPEDVAIDRSQAVDLFSLNTLQLQADLMAALLRQTIF